MFLQDGFMTGSYEVILTRGLTHVASLSLDSFFERGSGSLLKVIKGHQLRAEGMAQLVKCSQA